MKIAFASFILLLGFVLTACVESPEGAGQAPPPQVVVTRTVTTQTATPVAQTATPQPAQPNTACPDTGDVQKAIGLNVVRLGTESCGFTWRSVPLISVERTIPSGYLVTAHLTDNKIVVAEGVGQKLTFQGATFRVVNGYPPGDAVYDRCQLLKKEKAFGQSERPSFQVEPLGFTCP